MQKAEISRSVARPCSECAEMFLPGARGKLTTYCSEPCRSRAQSRARRDKRIAGRSEVICIQCGTSLADRIATAKYCSKVCTDIARGMRRAEPFPARFCALQECGEEFVPKRDLQMCCCEVHGRRHCQQVRRATGKEVREPWGDKDRDRYHRRRALKKSATTGEPVIFSDIAVRDAWMCGLCSELVDPNLAWPDPLSPSLDHIVPLTKGGSHDPSNVQLAHLRCNVSKGNRVDMPA